MMKRYYSQNGEDFLLTQLFSTKKDGFFVEIGCIDGLRFSNTLVFEKMGWSGVCVEAHKDYYPLVRANRQNSIVYDYAVGEVDEDNIRFYANSRGSLSTLDKSKERHFADHYGKWFTGFKEQVVNKRTLTSIFEEADVKDIDILSIDIEGYEVEALMGLDLKRYRPSVIVIESDSESHEAKIGEMLFRHGYMRGFRLSENIFYVRDIDLLDVLKEEYHIDLITTQNPFDLEGNIEYTLRLRFHENSGKPYYSKKLMETNESKSLL